jgi:uncharacterized metal-binding protein
MPSGKTHDRITIVLAAPAAAATYIFTQSLEIAAIVAVGFLFGGVMFGPDLDTVSRPYSRWGFARVLWFPYRQFFRHRSRWSHGLIFGTMIRVIYFAGVLTICIGGALILTAAAMGDAAPGWSSIEYGWRSIGSTANEAAGFALIASLLIGMWLGAASHTLTDIAITYIKSGRKDKLF